MGKKSFLVNNFRKVFMSIGERLREERERLGFNQPAFAGFAETTKQTLFSWETGNSSPKADQLEKLAERGVDVYYVLTGQRIGSVTVLSARESALVNNYRAAPEDAKRALETTIAYISKAPAGDPPAMKQTSISVGSNHGQVVEGGLVNNGPVSFGGGNNKK
jgi:transcriptional regulator with XRE-family HTH domain